MVGRGLSSHILKSHMSPVGASRERENREWCGGVPGWGRCRLVVRLADDAAARCAGDWGAGCPFLKPALPWHRSPLKSLAPGS